MNLRDLQYLVTVADTLHIGKAAEMCHVSQPTLSIQLKKLEESFGVVVFERAHKTLRLTAAGAALVERARGVVQGADALMTHAKSLRDPLAGELRLGAFPTLAPYYLPAIVPKITRALPKLKLLLLEDKTDRLLAQLDDGALDAALLAIPVIRASYRSHLLFEEPFLLAVPATHPLAKVKDVRVEDIRKEPLLLLEDGHCLRDQALQVCHVAGLSEDTGFRATSLETLRQMVAAGVGMTLMPQCAVVRSAQVKYIPFKGQPFTRQIGFIWRATHPRQALMEKLLAVMG